MKQKTFNRMLGICNVLFWFIFWGINYFSQKYKFGVKLEFSLMTGSEDYQNMILGFSIMFILMCIINIIFLFENLENKKKLKWFLIPAIFYLECAIAAFQTDLHTELISKAWAIIPAIIIVIKFIIELIHKKNIKTIILYILGILMSIAMFFVNTYNGVIWLVISIIPIFRNKEETRESRIKKNINMILLIAVFVTLIYIIIQYGKFIIIIRKTDKESEIFINQIKEGLRKETISESDVLIPVKQGNKWGYINQKGNEIVPCEYDCFTYELSSNYVVGTWFYLLKKSDIYYVISKNGNILATYKGYVTPWFKGAIEKAAKDLTKGRNEFEKTYYELFCAQATIEAYLSDEFSQRRDEKKNNILEYDSKGYTDEYDDIYVYNLENDYTLELTELGNYRFDEEPKYNIELKRNNIKINSYENVNVFMKYGDLYTYSNGDIPFFNLENKIQGYYSEKKKDFVVLKGKYQILDIIDDNLIIKNFETKAKQNEMIIKEDGRIILKAESVKHYEEGYIVKYEDNKIAFLNNNLEEVISNCAYINYQYIEKNLLICGYITDTGDNEYAFYDTRGKKLTNKKYEISNDEKNDFPNNIYESSGDYELNNIYEEYYN